MPDTPPPQIRTRSRRRGDRQIIVRVTPTVHPDTERLAEALLLHAVQGVQAGSPVPHPAGTGPVTDGRSLASEEGEDE